MSGGQDAPFGAYLRQAREAAGLSQEDLAARAGLSAKGISDLERGARRRPHPHTVRALADALGLSEDERGSLFAAVPKRGGADLAAPSAVPKPALPLPPTLLVGRERELAEVRHLLSHRERRLLTLTGTGGVGKTHLAIQAARESVDLFPDGAVFVALAPLNDPALVIPTVTRSLGLRGAEGQSHRETLRVHLHERHFLLMLDNFEHLLEAVTEVAELIEACPDLVVLATSRAPLRVRGEQEYTIRPLALPASTRSPTLKEVVESPSGRLFVERAQAACSTFEIKEGNAAAVAALCWRLSGLPLALELAAARVKFMDPTTLLSRLDRALSTGWTRDVPDRQRTMRATLEWSYDLLSEPEKALFRTLSVFAGGFSFEAVEAVGAAGEVGIDEILDLLGVLVEQSLVVAEVASGQEVRYRMLEPVRQYALEKLEESAEEDEARRRHARYYLALVEEAELQIRGWDQVGWLDRLEAENDNLRAAIGWSLDAGDARTATRFGWAMGMYWVMRARQGEGRILMEQTLAQGDDLPEKMRARALWALTTCVYGSGDDEWLMALCEEGVALSRRAGDSRAEAYTLGMMGFAALQLGELERASRVLEEALEMYREQGDDWGSAQILTHLAVVPLRQGDYPRVAELAEEALALTRHTGDRLAAYVALHLLAQAAWASDEHERAARYFREALVLASEAADKVDSAYYMQGLAAVAEARGEPCRAARLLGAAEALLEAAGLVIYAHASNELHQRVASAARERLGERAWTVARDEGRTMTFERAVEYAHEDDKV